MITFLLLIGVLGAFVTFLLAGLWFIARFTLPDWCAVPLLIGSWIVWVFFMRWALSLWLP